jgi:hypothetical protein
MYRFLFRALCWLGNTITVVAVLLALVCLMMMQARKEEMYNVWDIRSPDGAHDALLRHGEENPHFEVQIDGEVAVSGQGISFHDAFWKDAHTLVLTYSADGPQAGIDAWPAEWRGITIRYERSKESKEPEPSGSDNAAVERTSRHRS